APRGVRLGRRDLARQGQAAAHRILARPGIRAVPRERGDERINRDLGTATTVGETGGGRVRFRGHGRGQGTDVGSRVRVAPLGESLGEQGRLDEAGGRARLLPERVHGGGEG